MEPFRLSSFSHMAMLSYTALQVELDLLYLAKVESLVRVREGSELSRTSIHIHITGAKRRQEAQDVID